MASKNLIMGAACHYWWYQIEPFYVSCVRFNSNNCDCVAFIKDLSLYARDKLHDYRIHTEDIPEGYENKTANDYRFELFYQKLKEIWKNYDQVLISDTRDVLFQSPMFPEASHKEYLGVAVESGTICESGWNRRWIQDRFGMTVYNTFKDRSILCCGTIWGTSEEVMDLCWAISDNLSNPQFETAEYNDQAAFQYLVYSNMVPSKGTIQFSSLVGGCVATIGLKGDYSKDNDSIFSPAGGNNRPALVHQWDRHKELYPFVREHYREKHAKIRWKRYLNDYLSLKDIALSSYYGKHFVNMFIASFLYLIARKPKGERLWKK